MRNTYFSALSLPINHFCYALVGLLLLIYIGTIAVVMSYATLTVEFTQSVRTESSSLASLERQYLEEVAKITAVEYTTEGYAKPETKIFVRSKGGTALK